MTATAQALWYVAPGKAEIRAEPVAPPAEGEVRVRAVASALSRGTERLIFAGGVPESEYERMRAPFMSGTFPFPVKYGYAMVGRVDEGPTDLKGRLCFALYPHQTVFNLAAENIVPLPEGSAGVRGPFLWLTRIRGCDSSAWATISQGTQAWMALPGANWAP